MRAELENLVDDREPWFAVHVRSNMEKHVNAILLEKGYSTFLPLRRQRSRRANKTLQLERPLFPGYLFCHLDPQNRGPVVTIQHVVRVVGIGRTPIPIESDRIAAIRTIMGSGAPYASVPWLNVGERVTIAAGPLFGISGILVEERGKQNVVVSVDMVQRAVAVRVKRAWLSPSRRRPTEARWAPLVRAAATATPHLAVQVRKGEMFSTT